MDPPVNPKATNSAQSFFQRICLLAVSLLLRDTYAIIRGEAMENLANAKVAGGTSLNPTCMKINDPDQIRTTVAIRTKAVSSFRPFILVDPILARTSILCRTVVRILSVIAARVQRLQRSSVAGN